MIQRYQKLPDYQVQQFNTLAIHDVTDLGQLHLDWRVRCAYTAYTCIYIYDRYIYIYTYIHVIYIYTLYTIWLLYFESLKTPDPKKVGWYYSILQYYFLELLVLPDRLDDTSDPAGFRQPAGKVSIDLRIQRIQVDRNWTLKDITKRIFKVGSLKNLSPTFKSVHVMRGYERNSLSPSVNICQHLSTSSSDL